MTDGIIPKDHGTEKFAVTDPELADEYDELSWKELRALRRKTATEYRALRAFLDSIDREMKIRRDERVLTDVDTSDLDKTYVYPDDPEPVTEDTVKLYKDTPEGLVVYS